MDDLGPQKLWLEIAGGSRCHAHVAAWVMFTSYECLIFVAKRCIRAAYSAITNIICCMYISCIPTDCAPHTHQPLSEHFHSYGFINIKGTRDTTVTSRHA